MVNESEMTPLEKAVWAAAYARHQMDHHGKCEKSMEVADYQLENFRTELQRQADEAPCEHNWVDSGEAYDDYEGPPPMRCRHCGVAADD